MCSGRLCSPPGVPGDLSGPLGELVALETLAALTCVAIVPVGSWTRAWVSYLPMAWDAETIPGSHTWNGVCVSGPRSLVSRQDTRDAPARAGGRARRRAGASWRNQYPNLKNKYQMSTDQQEETGPTSQPCTWQRYFKSTSPRDS